MSYTVTNKSKTPAHPANSLAAEWNVRASEVMAGKQSNFRRGPVGDVLISDYAEGFRVFDVDGRDYIDFVLGMGPAIWGYSNKEFEQSVIEQMSRQFSAASSVMHTTQEIMLAEKIVEHVPCAELVRFGLSGSEVDQLAMRLARGYTGKRYILRCEGHYHGWLDNVFDGAKQADALSNPYPLKSDTAGEGIAPNALSDTMMVRWGDLDALEVIFQDHADDIAMIMMEAALCNNGCCLPRPGYLQGVRSLCDRYGVLLCFDEVITGFRMHIGGAQAVYDVTPDLAVFGKALAGGMPLAALAGKKDIMLKLKRNEVLGGGTFNSFPLAMASGLVSMDLLERDNFAYYRKTDEVQNKIRQGLLEGASKYGFKLMVQGPTGFLHFAFLDKELAHAPHELEGSDLETAQKFRTLLQENGVITGGGFRMVISGAMQMTDVEEAVNRIERSFAQLAEGQSQ